MAKDKELQSRIQKIGEMVEQLEATADPNARALAKGLLESLMALHGAGLERMLELASEAGEAGATIIRECAHDEIVSSLLLLYGLHPENISARIARGLEKSRQYLDSHGASAELVSVAEDGTARIRLHVKTNVCGSSAASVKAALETSLQDAAPDATLVVEELDSGPTQSGFVSLAQLESGRAIATLLAPKIQRSSI